MNLDATTWASFCQRVLGALHPTRAEESCLPSSTLQLLVLQQACWYLNENSRHNELEYFYYVVITWILGSLNIVKADTQRVK